MAGYMGAQPVPQAILVRKRYVLTLGQTHISTPGYTPGYVFLLLNGVELDDTIDYIATNGSDIVLTQEAAEGDILRFWTLLDFQLVAPQFTGLTQCEQLSVAADTIRIQTPKTPTAANAPGSQGQIAWDTNYLYVCIATNTWRRTPLTSW